MAALKTPPPQPQQRAQVQPPSPSTAVSGTVSTAPAVPGQATAANSAPVVLASDQPAVPVTGTFWQATQPISGNVGVTGSVAVTGSFWQATQPVSGTVTANAGTGTFAVSGPLTDTQLRASPVPVSGTVTTQAAEAAATFRGRASTFRTPGRAGTTGQKIFALHNATGSAKVVHLNQIAIDCVQLAVIAVTVVPPIIRAYRFTAVPTNGTALTKVAKDSTQSSNASVTAWSDASADGTNSTTALTVTLGSPLTAEFAPRLITAAGYEMFDRTELLTGFDLVLRPLEGVCVMLDYSTTTANPTTTHWVVTADWYEL
jgi:hypothetical protein